MEGGGWRVEGGVVSVSGQACPSDGSSVSFAPQTRNRKPFHMANNSCVHHLREARVLGRVDEKILFE
jgi:hypothetical protein